MENNNGTKATLININDTIDQYIIKIIEDQKHVLYTKSETLFVKSYV